MDTAPGDTRNLTGTSYSTPAIAGEAALIRQYFREGYYPDGISGGPGQNVSAALVKAVLLSAAHEIRAGIGETVEPSPHQHLKVDAYPNQITGWGRVVADDVLYFSGEAKGP